jgi:hypothetical protein
MNLPEAESTVLGQNTSVVYDLDARGLEHARDVVVADPELEPHRARSR